MGRRRSNILRDVYEIGAMLPWWLGAPIALAAYIFLHGYAASDPTLVSDPAKALDGQMVRRTAKRGTHAGEQFWGCSRYPVCRAILT